ncbi:hypothetical protein [Sphingopyxis sp. OAS728]|uniref:hypothetical protein n=1 Tax=Sphingopyxis sp. OAS728 TaxID=2663823 RepID=UPI001CEF1261|nr:hypothetical protein [Sphingopyxis sp. OAS728]
MQQVAFRSENSNLPNIDLHALCQRADMIAAIAASLGSHSLARSSRELREHVRRERLLPRSAERGGDALRIGLGLIARRLERCDALFEVRVVHVGNAVLDCVKEPL